MHPESDLTGPHWKDKPLSDFWTAHSDAPTLLFSVDVVTVGKKNTQ